MRFMDLLFKRYADPFSLLDGYIQTARMCEFVHRLAKQQAEDDRWEFYLHKVWDKSFTEFCESMQTSQDPQVMSDEDLKATVLKSMNILGNFNPEQGEGEI